MFIYEKNKFNFWKDDGVLKIRSILLLMHAILRIIHNLQILYRNEKGMERVIESMDFL